MSLNSRLNKLEDAQPDGPVVPLALIEGDTVRFWGEEMTLAEYEAFKEEHAEMYEAAARNGQITAVVFWPPEEAKADRED